MLLPELTVLSSGALSQVSPSRRTGTSANNPVPAPTLSYPSFWLASRRSVFYRIPFEVTFGGDRLVTVSFGYFSPKPGGLIMSGTQVLAVFSAEWSR